MQSCMRWLSSAITLHSVSSLHSEGAEDFISVGFDVSRLVGKIEFTEDGEKDGKDDG